MPLHDLYKNILELDGHQVVDDAYNGEEGVSKYQDMNPKPELIILDYHMPIKNGLDTAKEILEINPNQKIIFISADENMVADLKIRWASRELGVAAFINKPFSVNKLSKTVKNVI